MRSGNRGRRAGLRRSLRSTLVFALGLHPELCGSDPANSWPDRCRKVAARLLRQQARHGLA
jgi:hypothetical protein